jgi:hypothetical protein
MHRRTIMNEDLQSEITRQLTVQTISAKILASLRVSDLVTEINDNYENS